MEAQNLARQRAGLCLLAQGEGFDSGRRTQEWHQLRSTRDLERPAKPDLGLTHTSLANGRDVLEEIAPRFANTMFLAAYAALVAVPLAVVTVRTPVVDPDGTVAVICVLLSTV